MTYTLVTLELSHEAYDEIKGKLEDAGYYHVFNDDGGTPERPMIDMTHIGLVPVGSGEPAD